MPRTGQPKGNSQKFWLLVRAGPMTVDELDGAPGVSERRVYDMRQFNPLRTTEGIWYLGEFHDERRVLQMWFAENMETLKNRDVTRKAMTYHLSGEFADAWSEIRDDDQFDWLDPLLDDATPESQPDVDPDPSSAETDGGGHRCPRCGREDVGNLPNHIRACDGSE